MKKVTFFLSALALVAFAACNNAAVEPAVDATDDATMEAPVAEEDSAAAAAAATPEVAADGAPATAE
jgi:hypothetical protein